MKVLSADDSIMMRKVIRNTVESLGCGFLEAADGAEALSVLDKNHAEIGLVLLDWNMPGMNGIEVLKRIKGDARFQNIPVIMVTTEIDRKKMIEAVACGARDYITKPFSQEDLREKVRQGLGMRS